MSNKKNIDNIADIVSRESHILIRDLIELERLQSVAVNISEQFAIASYRKFTQKVIAKLTNLVSAYKIYLPNIVHCSYNGFSQNILIEKILDIKEFENIGNEDVGIFMISPIDGMINFSRSVPSFCFGMSILINNDDRIVPNQGLVYDIPNNKLYTATVGAGSFLNNGKLVSSNRSKINVSSISVSNLENLIKETIGNTDTLKFASKIKNLTISCANYLSGIPSQLALCYLASGKIDVAIETNLKSPETIISGLIIAKEAGCYIFNQNGDEITIDDVLSLKEKNSFSSILYLSN